jgi:hypothetical protein
MRRGRAGFGLDRRDPPSQTVLNVMEQKQLDQFYSRGP